MIVEYFRKKILEKQFFARQSWKHKDKKHISNIFNELKIRNIELTGNLFFEKNYKNILKEYKSKYKFNYLIHNYFPIPKKPFMLNLGTENSYLNRRSVENCFKAIELCNELKIKKFSVHAPFLVNFKTTEAGKKIKKRLLIKSQIKKNF